MIDLKGELANSKAGQAAIKHAVSAAAKEQAASAAGEKALKVRPSHFYFKCHCRYLITRLHSDWFRLTIALSRWSVLPDCIRQALHEPSKAPCVDTVTFSAVTLGLHTRKLVTIMLYVKEACRAYALLAYGRTQTCVK